MSTSIKSIIAIVVISVVAIGIGVWKSPKFAQAVQLGAPEISEKAEAHILHGDKKGGGHFHTAKDPCKSKFPKDWDEADVLGNIRKVAANDNLKWKKEKNGYYTATDMVDGVKIRVVLDKERDDVVTGYPINGSANRCANAPARKAAMRKKSAPAVTQVEPAANDNEDAPAMPNASSRQPRSYNFNAN